jgi:hypothetical protein
MFSGERNPSLGRRTPAKGLGELYGSESQRAQLDDADAVELAR